MMPYLLLVCLTGFLSAVQNALEQFAVPALASCLLNICWIAGVISITFFPTLGIYSVAIAVLVSGFLQVWMQVWSVRTKGVRFRFDPDWRAPEIGKMINLMWPVVVGLGVTQINFLVDGFIAWFCVPNIGGNAVLFYGNRLMQFPLGVFGIAIGTAIFPALAKYAARGDRESFLSFMNQGIRSTLFVAVPSAALMIALARPIVELVYQRGQFTLQSTDRTTAVLIYYTAGLWAYCALQVVTRAFYALQDTRTPVKVGAWMVLCNLLLNLTLVWPMWEGGIALATAITATLNLIIMGNILRGRMGRIGASSVLISALRICAVTAAAGAASLLLLKMLPSIETRPNLHWKMARVLIPLAGGSVVFLGVCMAVGLTEWQEFLDAFRKRRQAQTGTASSLEQVKPS
jgi:putative peptidoglycan lipid II flippase